MTAAVDKTLLEAIENCFQDPDIRSRSYYPEFRRGWDSVFARARKRDEEYFDFSSPACFVMHNEYAGISYDFHIDQLKICEWYEKELANRKKFVFFGKKLKRDKKSGNLMFHDAVCHYDPTAEEAALEENMRNVIACALPCMPVSMQIVYGNKWVDKRFNILRRNTVDIFLIGTDFVPAFLGSAFEAALYLFLMDCCIIKTNLGKAKDEDIKNLLHVMRPSPMLRIKGLA